jgi:hypothetical protein
MRKADKRTTILCHCHVIWELYFLEPSGSLQACNGTALLLTNIERMTWATKRSWKLNGYEYEEMVE